jgi:hypothetical protein
MVVLGEKGFQRHIHNIENTPFRTKFEADLHKFQGNAGIGCISDSDPQPLLVRSQLGLFAITTVGRINNADQLLTTHFSSNGYQFMAMSSGKINATELTAALINQKEDLVAGIRFAQEQIKGSMTIIILTEKGEIYAARDAMGRLPVLVGQNLEGCCVSFESFAYQKLGYQDYYELGPKEIVKVTSDGVQSLSPAGDLIFRVLAASSIQLFFCRRKWPAALKLLPLILTGGFALWGCLLYLGDSVSWQNATFFDLLADYLSPAIACAATTVLHRFSRNTER